MQTVQQRLLHRREPWKCVPKQTTTHRLNPYYCVNIVHSRISNFSKPVISNLVIRICIEKDSTLHCMDAWSTPYLFHSTEWWGLGISMQALAVRSVAEHRSFTCYVGFKTLWTRSIIPATLFYSENITWFIPELPFSPTKIFPSCDT